MRALFGQGAEGNGQLVAGSVVIEVAVVKMVSQRRSALRLNLVQAKSGMDCRLCQGEAVGRAIIASEVKVIVRLS